jgi:heme ABC exporter ATP-binding subunit CcmA
MGAAERMHPVTQLTPVVQLNDVVALIGRFPALAGATLRVEAGEVVLLQGPNGAGKTSLLRLCAGLLRIESGEGRVLGFDLSSDHRSVRPHVGLLAHHTGLYDDLTVGENVDFWARAVRAGSAEVEEALDHLGLGGRLRDVPVRRLSAGQRRRTALATMLVRRPELWLLDEPHAALDSAGRELVDDLILGAAAAGATVILASHELDRVGTLDPRVVTIAGGRVVADSEGPTPADQEGVDSADQQPDPTGRTDPRGVR